MEATYSKILDLSTGEVKSGKLGRPVVSKRTDKCAKP